MITDKFREIEAMRAKLAQLEAIAVAERDKELVALPERYGFATTDEFIKALRAAASAGGAAGTQMARKPVQASKGAAASKAAPTPKASTRGASKRTRATITDETRAQLKRLVQEGKTGSEISKALGISLASVHNVKRALGLIQKD